MCISNFNLMPNANNRTISMFKGKNMDTLKYKT